MDGEAMRSCVTPLGKAAGAAITTIEGLDDGVGRRLIAAWTAEDTPQCGYCQPGMVVAAAALLRKNPRPDDAAVEKAMTGICRCGTYQRIKKAIRRAVETDETASGGGSCGFAPSVFAGGVGELALGPAVTGPVYFLNAWVGIGSDGRAVVRLARSEMGQGVAGSLPLLVAEELEVDPADVSVEMAAYSPSYKNKMLGSMMTGGSTSVRESFDRLRRKGASAREMLIETAAGRWGVPKSECRAEKGRVIHPEQGEIGYGELAEEASRLTPPTRPALKSADDWTILGNPGPRPDGPDKTLGRAVFGMDVRFDGLLTAAVKNTPIFGGRVARYDADSVRSLPGVAGVYEVPGGVAVVGETYWQARHALINLDMGFDPGPNQGLDSGQIEKNLVAALHGKAAEVKSVGDVRAVMGGATRTLEADYFLPLLAHATMESMNCSARVDENGCDIWAPTQAQGNAHAAAKEITGLPDEAIRIHTTFLGGGFGRRLEIDYVAQAVALAQKTGRPVKVVWSRAEDMRHDFYRPPSVHRLRAALDETGRIAALRHRIVSPSILERFGSNRAVDPTSVEGAHDQDYAFPNHLVEWSDSKSAVPLGFWRSVGHSHTAFALEAFLDEAAYAGGVDPLEFRLELLKDSPKFGLVLRTAAEMAGWSEPRPAGVGVGLALHKSFGSIVGMAVEVAVDGSEIELRRVSAAVDCGRAIHRDTIAAQMEGGTVFGLTAAMFGEITVKNGRVKQTGFRDYPMMLLKHIPEIRVQIIESGDFVGGIGEPAVPLAAPALVNAVFNAAGKRIRRLPLAGQGFRLK
jgi:isoquinoline 1-oxidoreductase beta subunit